MTELNDNAQGQETNPGTENLEDKATFTREEVEALLQKEGDRRVSQALAKQERKYLAQAREAQKLANMNEQERYEFELQKREEAIAEKEHALLIAENKNEAAKILAEKGLSISLIDFVIADTADEMADNISKLEKAFKASVKAEVERRIKGNTPIASSNNNDGPITKEKFKTLSLAEKQNLYYTDRELYNSLSSN